MIIKYVFGLALVACGGLIGYKFTDKVRFKRDIYCEMVGLITDLISQIGYSRMTIDRIVEALPENLKALLGEKLSVLAQGDTVQFDLKGFTPEENKLFEEFFNGLGRYEVEGQIEMLKYYNELFKSRQIKCTETYEKNSRLSVKLGALSGVLVFVIVM